MSDLIGVCCLNPVMCSLCQSVTLNLVGKETVKGERPPVLQERLGLEEQKIKRDERQKKQREKKSRRKSQRRSISAP
jgi:hypothetical protein